MQSTSFQSIARLGGALCSDTTVKSTYALKDNKVIDVVFKKHVQLQCVKENQGKTNKGLTGTSTNRGHNGKEPKILQ